MCARITPSCWNEHVSITSGLKRAHVHSRIASALAVAGSVVVADAAAGDRRRRPGSARVGIARGGRQRDAVMVAALGARPELALRAVVARGTAGGLVAVVVAGIGDA